MKHKDLNIDQLLREVAREGFTISQQNIFAAINRVKKENRRRALITLFSLSCLLLPLNLLFIKLLPANVSQLTTALGSFLKVTTLFFKAISMSFLLITKPLLEMIPSYLSYSLLLSLLLIFSATLIKLYKPLKILGQRNGG